MDSARSVSVGSTTIVVTAASPILRATAILFGGGCARSVERELVAPLAGVGDRRLCRLLQDVALENEDVHAGAHEAPVRILRSTDDRLAADVERGVDDEGASGAPVKCRDDVVEQRIGLAADRLNAGRVVDVG